jgi:hypothetical protein
MEQFHIISAFIDTMLLIILFIAGRTTKIQSDRITLAQDRITAVNKRIDLIEIIRKQDRDLFKHDMKLTREQIDLNDKQLRRSIQEVRG